MKRKLVFKFLFPIWIFLIFFPSCKEIDLTNISNQVKIDESLVLPLGSGSASMADILSQYVSKSNIVTIGDTINYVDTFLYDYKFKDVNLLASASSKQITIPLTAATISANQTVPVSIGNQLIDLGLNPASTTQRVDSTFVTSSSVGVTVSVSNITVASNGLPISPSDLKVTLVFPTIYNQSNHAPVSINITPYLFNSAYSLQLNNVIVNTVGQTGVPVQILLSAGTRSIKTVSTSTVNVGLVFNSINFTAAYGLFQPSSSTATIIKVPLDMLSSLPKGLQFANPKAFINIQSNIGTWLDYNIDYVKAYNKSKSVTVNATFNGNPTALEIIKTKPTAPQQFSSWDLTPLDKNYGTTNKLFETNVQLDTLEYKFSLVADANSPAPNFVVPGMEMKAKVKVQIPMYLEAGSTYNYIDTIQYSSNIDLSYVDQGILVARITNGLPVKTTLSLKLLDANKHLISSTLNDSTWVINAGNVNNVGIVTSSTLTSLNINLSSTQMADIKNAKYFAFTVLLAGQDVSKQIQFTKNDIISVKLGIFAKANKTTTIGSGNN
ncbi:MAG: hypothetical protein P4L34_06835 [Paludibacter sp.]|nr:hypothetical protein [Paludibacter sp.]